MIWVIDASVAVRWFIEDEIHPNAEKVLIKLIGQPDVFTVPELFAFEVYAVLQRLHPEGLEVFREGIIPLLQGGMFRQPMTGKLALKANRYVQMGLTGYDACYAALAKDVKGMWLTFDREAHILIQKENVSFFIGQRMPSNWSE
ncbi:MAG: type II toxin-antitoxin system VapC family toxin [Proteobacteria bacterium]|nr:type II toxin-antitoxin system VapC family toxin [Pseudomonadota bacterium]